MTEVAADFAQAWRNFQAADSVRLLQETLEWEWTRGRSDYAAFLIQVTGPAVRERIASTVQQIAGIPGVDPYPEDYWHVTIKGAGFILPQPTRDDELSPAAVEAMAEAARPLLERQSPFRVELGRINAFAEVVFMEVLDGGAIRTLNERLLGGVAGLKQGPVDGANFLPHISIARFSSAEGMPELKQTLTRLREHSPEEAAGFTVRDALLIRAHLGGAAPTFETLAAYPLRG